MGTQEDMSPLLCPHKGILLTPLREEWSRNNLNSSKTIAIGAAVDASSIIPACGRPRREARELEASLGYIGWPVKQCNVVSEKQT